MNDYTIAGNTTRDAEVFNYEGGSLLKFTIAVDRGYYSKQKAEWVDRVDFTDCIRNYKESGFAMKAAERILKGSVMMVTGTPYADSYLKRGTTDIVQKLSLRILNMKQLSKPKTVIAGAPLPQSSASGALPQASASHVPMGASAPTLAPLTSQEEDDLPF